MLLHREIRCGTPLSTFLLPLDLAVFSSWILTTSLVLCQNPRAAPHLGSHSSEELDDAVSVLIRF